MGLREWSVGGVLLSPFLIYVVLALLVTGGITIATTVGPTLAGRRLPEPRVIARLVAE